MTSLRERLLAKAVINWETGCWEWTGSLNHHGYGRISPDGYPKRKIKVHRASYEMAYGPIAEGLTIDHLCRVRHCINPAHLEAVAGHENTLRGFSMAGVNARKTHCDHGHEFTPENTYSRPRGGRDCRACRREWDAGRNQSPK